MDGFLIILAILFLVSGPLGAVGFFMIGGLRNRLDAQARQIAILERRVELAEARGIAPSAPTKAVTDPPIDLATPRAMEPPVEDDGPAPEPDREPALLASPSASLDIYSKPEPNPLASSAVQPPKPARPALDLETLLGAKGSVWIGGLALLLGAVFLLRYSIEAGLLTPGLRVALAALLGIVSLGVSEVLAKRDLRSPIGAALSARADIPALLAAVGVFSLFGAGYAAHALYGLLPALPAFAIMAVVALAAMALSLRRGPWLAAIGLIGALAVPLLVTTDTPSFIGVFAYTAIITAAALALARMRDWPWLTLAASAGATFWLSMLLGKAGGTVEVLFWAAGLAAMVALVLRSLRPFDKDKPLYGYAGWTGLFVLTALASAQAGVTNLPGLGGAVALWSPVALFAALFWYAQIGKANWRWPALLVGGAVAGFGFVPWALQAETLDAKWLGLAVVAALALAALVSARRIAERFEEPRFAAVTMAVGAGLVILFPLALLEFNSWKPEGYHSVPGEWVFFIAAGIIASVSALTRNVWVAAGALSGAALAWLIGVAELPAIAETVARNETRGVIPVTYASAAPWQSAMLSLGAALALILAAKRDTWLARLVGVGLLGFAGLLAVQTLGNPDVHYAATPMLNQLWLYFGLPGVVAAAGAVWLGARRDDIGSQLLLAASLVFTLVMTVLLIHHTVNAGDLSAEPGFEDIAVQLLVAFALLLGGSWVKATLTTWPGHAAPRGERIIPALAIGLSAVSLIVFVTSQLIAFNPLFNGETAIDGPPIFNALLLGFLLPSVLLGAAAIRYSGTRPVWFVRVLGGLAGVSWLAWTTAQIRVFAQGPQINLGAVPWDNAELYAVSAAWLLTAMGLLAVGWKTGRRDLRLGAVSLLTLTTLKVFLLDMAELDGALRPLSFIGLGVVLLGIGRLYQTVLKSDDA